MNCLIKKPKSYDALYETYWYEPDLLNLISRMSVAPFFYELNAELRPGSVTHCDLLRGMLKFKPVRDLLQSHPRKLYEFCCTTDLKLPMFEVEGVLDLMEARVLMFEDRYRGPIMEDGAVTEVQFRSSLGEVGEKRLKSYLNEIQLAIEGVQG